MEKEESNLSNISQNSIDSNQLILDVLKIDSLIKINKIYEENNIKFQFCLDYQNEDVKAQDENKDYPKYISEINFNSFNYLGILSKKFIKEIRGYKTFNNGDEYFGQWKQDKKNGHGIYFYKNEDKEEDTSFNQLYIGEFESNIKSGRGIYFNVKKFSDIKKDRSSSNGSEIIISEDKKDGVPTPLEFTVAIGNFVNDIFLEGIVVRIEEGHQRIYKGKIVKGKKNDENGEIYEDENKIFIGKLKDNIMIEGRIIILNEGKKEEGYYFYKNGKDGKGEIEFDYNKDRLNDDHYIKKLNDFNSKIQCSDLQDLFKRVMKIRESCNDEDRFEYMKNLNYDIDIKQDLQEEYEKYFPL
jgi:hypothetical protein